MTTRKLYIGPLTDNRRWDRFHARPDDVYVVTPPKSGTTWMQSIVGLLISGRPDGVRDMSATMPWLDIRMRPISEVAARLDAMTERRCIKSHTPMDGLPVGTKGQYLCVFRHPLDAHFSFRKHVANMNMPASEYFFPSDGDSALTFSRFLAGAAEGHDMDAMPLAHVLRHYQAARHMADRCNVTLFHYADMRADLAGTVARVAELLGVEHPADVMGSLVQSASFEHMRANADRFAPGGGTGFYKSDAGFFDSGSSGKWEGVLSDDELARYDAIMDKTLSREDRHWLEFGSIGPT